VELVEGNESLSLFPIIYCLFYGLYILWYISIHTVVDPGLIEVGAKVQKLAKHSVKQQNNDDRGGGQMPRLPTPGSATVSIDIHIYTVCYISNFYGCITETQNENTYVECAVLEQKNRNK